MGYDSNILLTLSPPPYTHTHTVSYVVHEAKIVYCGDPVLLPRVGGQGGASEAQVHQGCHLGCRDHSQVVLWVASQKNGENISE